MTIGSTTYSTDIVSYQFSKVLIEILSSLFSLSLCITGWKLAGALSVETLPHYLEDLME
jgi:hypothetical protein